MINKQRHKIIVDMLNDDKVVSVSELSEKLNLSMMTIRRDLTYMEEKGLLKKVHGGAVLVKKEETEPSFYERIEKFSEVKVSIGKAAAALIQQNDVAIFDAGTTTLAAAQSIPADLNLTAITSSLMTAVALSGKPNVNLIMVGGNIHGDSLSSTGIIVLDQLKKFNADIAFFSTKGLHPDEGAFELLLPLIEVKKAMQSVSKKIVLLADSSKFGKKSLSLSLPIDCIDIIITDKGTPEEIVHQIKKKNIRVIVAG